MSKRDWPFQVNINIKPIGERQAVTLGIWLLAIGLLLMAREDPKLWEVKLFEILLQAVIISGIIGSILAFHFAANKGDESKTENTRVAFEALRDTARAVGAPEDVKKAAEEAAGKVADAAVDAAEEVVQGSGAEGDIKR